MARSSGSPSRLPPVWRSAPGDQRAERGQGGGGASGGPESAVCVARLPRPGSAGPLGRPLLAGGVGGP
eukprot:15484524-Alexandrium_andersonii.AAC.1